MIFILRLGKSFKFSGSYICLLLFLCYFPYLFGFYLLYAYFIFLMMCFFNQWLRLLFDWFCDVCLHMACYCLESLLFCYFSACILNLPLLGIFGLLGQVHHWKSNFGFDFASISLFG
jgi:hypothetical protein